MINKKNWLGILLMVFVLTVASWGQDKTINGTWVYDFYEFTFIDGNFELLNDGKPDSRGTYTTNNNIITLTYTYVHGGILNNEYDFDYDFQLKWYSKNELKPILVPSEISENDFNEWYFFTISYNYFVSLSGNILNMTFENNTDIFRRKR